MGFAGLVKFRGFSVDAIVLIPAPLIQGCRQWGGARGA